MDMKLFMPFVSMEELINKQQEEVDADVKRNHVND